MCNNFSIAEVFTSNMVLQRDKINPIWGEAADTMLIRAEFCGHVFSTVSANGKWCLNIPPLDAGGPYEMNIQCGDSKIHLSNILIGEVWIAGGQSNMEFCLKGDLHASTEIPKANYQSIRLYKVPAIAHESDRTAKASLNRGWQECTPENVLDFSAVGYYFTKEMFQALNVPIGIISCNWGGTSASCWMNEDFLSKDDEVRVYLDEYNNVIQNTDEAELDRKFDEYNKNVENYAKLKNDFMELNPNADQLEIEKNVGCYPWPPPVSKKSFMRPAGLYYTMLKKIVPYGIKGVIFYQGEADTLKNHLYHKLFSNMIANWRQDWENPELPFIFTQITMFNCNDAPDDNFARIREQQMLTLKHVKNTGMAVITDCGDRNNIHPTNKQPVGERLAKIALAKTYGLNVEYSGPIFRQMKIDGNKLIIDFDFSEGGLKALDGKLKGFTICGEDGIYIDAQAEINGNSVIVYAEGLLNPKNVRYAWGNYIDANLYNIHSLPASPFRTESA